MIWIDWVWVAIFGAFGLYLAARIICAAYFHSKHQFLKEYHANIKENGNGV